MNQTLTMDSDLSTHTKSWGHASQVSFTLPNIPRIVLWDLPIAHPYAEQNTKGPEPFILCVSVPISISPNLPGVSLSELVDEVWGDDEPLYASTARKELARVQEHHRKGKGGNSRSALAELRLAAGLNQKQLAKRLGTSQPYISSLEKFGLHKNPSAKRVRELASALSVTTDKIWEVLND